MKYFWAFICCMLTLTACKDNSKHTEENIDKRTVIIYISGENNLNYLIESDISEMVQGSAGMPDNCNLLAFVDKADANTPPYILHIEKGEKKIVTDYTFKEDFYASDPGKMYDIIGWVMKEYPAENYGLVLWGHASGWFISNDSIAIKKRAYGGDNGNNSTSGSGNIWMNIPTMAEVFERLPNKFKFIMADCCNFQCAEIAYELKDVTDYLIGSPAEIPGDGAPYDRIVPHLFSNKNDFYKDIVDQYCNYYATSDGSGVPMSAIKTSEMEQLAAATSTLMPEIMSKTLYTDTVAYYNGTPKVMFDINDLIRINISDGKAYSQWKESLDRAVSYRRHSSDWQTMGFVTFSEFNLTEWKYGGMSMFVPMDIYDKRGRNWNRCISKMKWFYATGMNRFYKADEK